LRNAAEKLKKEQGVAVSDTTKLSKELLLIKNKNTV
jgi:hypothetical protein